MTTVGYLGHSVFAFEHEGKTALVDPWLTGNTSAAVTADEVAADVIFLTHDHIGDAVAIAKRTGAPSWRSSGSPPSSTRRAFRPWGPTWAAASISAGCSSS
jgi:L-ascorbate metabolism protein UlaG (beta-lactamase superfamily)